MSFIGAYGAAAIVGRRPPHQGQRSPLNFLRRISLNRLLLLCGIVVGVGIGATALAEAIGAGPTPKPQSLAQAIHGGLTAPAPEGVSANIQLTDQLLEGAGLASDAGGGGGEGGEGGSLTSSPLFTGGSGRLWASKDGRFRLELQDQSGDTQIVSDGHKLEIYDAATNTLYRYKPPAGESAEGSSGSDESRGRRPRSAVRDEDRRSDLPPAEARLRVRGRTDRRRRAAGLHGAGRAEGSGEPVRRRRAVVQRRQRHPPAGGPLLDRRLLAGARTGGHRNLLRARAGLGLLDHASLEREGRGSEGRGAHPRRSAPPLRHPRVAAEGDHLRPRAGLDRGGAGQVEGQGGRAAASKGCPR